MDDYERGLLAGSSAKAAFIVTENRGSPHALRVAVGPHRRHQRFLRDTQRAVGLGAVLRLQLLNGRVFVKWHIDRTAELVELCNLLDADRFVERCDWVAWRYTRFRTQLRQRLAARDYGAALRGWASS